ncbi:MAG: hypothetical protein AB7N65_24015 [Vicinamibacterales bacterium]
MDFADLERDIHARLTREPAPRAPVSLRMRVMAAVAARGARPWYRRSWFTWPLTIQVASGVAACVAVAVTLVWGPSALEQAGVAVVGLAQHVPSAVHGDWPAPLRRAVEMLDAARVVWRVLLRPVILLASVFTVLVGGFFALCVTLLTQSSIGRTAA